MVKTIIIFHWSPVKSMPSHNMFGIFYISQARERIPKIPNIWADTFTA
jgi:hypothetical protein